MANYRQLAGSPPVLGTSVTCSTCPTLYEYSDSPLVGYTSSQFSEQGLALYASSAEFNLAANQPSIGMPSITTPTQASPYQQVDTCINEPNTTAYFEADLVFNSQQQSKGAIVVFISLYKGASQAALGHALPIRFQTRTDYQDPNGWVDTAGIHGWVMNNSTTNQGFGGTWISSLGGSGWRANGGADVTGGGFGGPGTLQVSSTTQNSGQQNYLFAFEDVGDFRLLTGLFQGTDGQCQDGTSAIQNQNWDMSIDSLWDGTGTLYDYYVTTSPSGSATGDTTKYYMAYEPYGKFVKQFYEYDTNGNLVAAPLSGTHYWKRLSGVTNPTIINPEVTDNGQYTGNLTAGTTGVKVGYSTLTQP
jgi:hypothetical protein